MGSGSRGDACRAGGSGGGGGLGSVACDDEGGVGWEVLGEVTVEGDEVLSAARGCVVAGRWAAFLDPRVGGWRWGDGGLEVAVAGGRRQNLLSAGVRGVPAAAAEQCRVRKYIRPDEAGGEVETETPEVDDGETTGGLQAKPGGAPVKTVAFSELEGDLAMWSKVDIWPTETLQDDLMARPWTKRGSVGTR